MKEVLLVTIWDNKNIGNRLQALALKTVIEGFGYTVTSALYDKETTKGRIKRYVKQFLGFIGVAKFRKAYCLSCRTHVILIQMMN